MVEYHLASRTRRHTNIHYTNVPYFSNISHDDPNLIPYGIYYTKEGIATCGPAHRPTSTTQPDTSMLSLPSYFSTLPSALRQICGTINIPNDDGMQLISKCRCKGNRMLGASDASFCQGNATHAWVISSGEVSDLETPNLHISGYVAVDGYSHHMSSGRGELHGITALSIMTDVLHNYHNFKPRSHTEVQQFIFYQPLTSERH
jgi:hypothetical protein